MRKVLFLLIIIFFISFAYAIDEQLNSFDSRTNPFNIYFLESGQNVSTLSIPTYSYVKNFSVGLTSHSIDKFSYNDNFNVGSIGNFTRVIITGGGNIMIQQGMLRVAAGLGQTVCASYNISNATFVNFSQSHQAINKYSFVAIDDGFYSDYSIRCGYYLGATTDFYCVSGTSDHVVADMDISKNYDITITNIDYSNYVYDVMINGTLYDNGGNHWSFRRNGTNQTRVLFCGNNGVDLFFDNMTINGTKHFSKTLSFPTNNFTVSTTGVHSYSLDHVKLNNILNNNCNAGSVSETNCILDFTIISNGAGNVSVNLTNLTYSFGLDNCSNSFNIPSNLTALNVTFFDSSNSFYSVDYEVYSDYNISTNMQYNYSFFGSITNFSMCIYPNWSYAYTDTVIEYANQSYNTYHLLLNHSTTNLYLQVQDSGTTTQVTFSVVDYSTNPVKDAYIHIMKWNPGTGAYITTEILKTDSTGQATGNIVLVTEFYKFIVYYEGTVRLTEPTTQGIKVYSTTRTFRISTAETEWFDDLGTVEGATTSLIFNNASNSFVYTWSEPTGEMHYGCLRVTKSNASGTYTLTDNCTMAASSSMVYQIIPVNGSRFTAIGYFKFDFEYITNILEQIYAYSYELWQKTKTKEPVTMALILIMALTLIGIPAPEVSFILMGVGLILVFAVGLWQVSLSLVVAIILLGMIHAYMGNKK